MTRLLMAIRDAAQASAFYRFWSFRIFGIVQECTYLLMAIKDAA